MTLSHAQRPGVQCAEFGTYISTVSDPDLKGYLTAGAAFYRTWGHPNVRQVDTLKDVLDDLDRSSGPIDSFRLVAHGLGTALEIGLIPELGNDSAGVKTVGATETGLTSEASFRTALADPTIPKILSDAAYTTLVGVLQKDAAAKALLDTLGAGSSVPATNSSLGIVVRAMLEKHYLNTVQLDTGGAPKIANRSVLDAYNQTRISTYSAVVINEADPAKKGDVTKALASLATEVPAAMQRDGRTFKLTQSDADTLADPFVDAKTKDLKPELTAEVREGAGGPFLKRLRSVRKEIGTNTHIEVRGCNIGSSPTFMDQLRGFFGDPTSLPSLSAPDLFQYFFRLSYATLLRTRKMKRSWPGSSPTRRPAWLPATSNRN